MLAHLSFCIFSAIKIGRYSIQKKTENICQVKTLEEDRNSTERSSLIPNTNANRTTKHALSSENKGVNSPSSSSENSAILNLYLSNDQTDTGSPSGDSEYGFTGRKNRSAGELTLKEIDTYVKTLYHAHKSLLVKAETFIQVDQLKRHQREYFVSLWSFSFPGFVAHALCEQFGLRSGLTKRRT